jgi:hypothetical protein
VEVALDVVFVSLLLHATRAAIEAAPIATLAM